MPMPDKVERLRMAASDWWRNLDPGQRRRMSIALPGLILGLIVLIVIYWPSGGGGARVTGTPEVADIRPLEGPIAERDLAGLRSMTLEEVREADAARRAELDRLRRESPGEAMAIRLAEAAVERSSLVLEEKQNGR